MLTLPDDPLPDADAVVSIGHVISYLPDEAAVDRALWPSPAPSGPAGCSPSTSATWPRGWPAATRRRWGGPTTTGPSSPSTRCRRRRGSCVRWRSSCGVTTASWTRDDERHDNVLIDTAPCRRGWRRPASRWWCRTRSVRDPARGSAGAGGPPAGLGPGWPRRVGRPPVGSAAGRIAAAIRRVSPAIASGGRIAGVPHQLGPSPADARCDQNVHPANETVTSDRRHRIATEGPALSYVRLQSDVPADSPPNRRHDGRHHTAESPPNRRTTAGRPGLSPTSRGARGRSRRPSPPAGPARARPTSSWPG